MASESGTEIGKRENIYEKDPGTRGCTFPYFETASNWGTHLLI